MDDEQLTMTIGRILGQVPGWVFPSTSSAKVGIFYGPIGSAPDQAIGIRVYGLANDQRSGIRGRRLQLRSRGAKNKPNGADEIGALAAAVVEGLSRVEGISGVTHLSMAPLGADGSGRQERTDNFIITFDNHKI